MSESRYLFFIVTIALLLALEFVGTDLRAAVTSETVATGLSSPIFVSAAPGDTSRLFIVEQGGLIKIIKDGSVLPRPFLDLSADIVCCGERGLLGLAFHPDYFMNNRFYVYYTATGGGSSGKVRIVQFEVSTDPDSADHASATYVLDINQPYTNHNGGMIAFGPNDGYLYAGPGDGGAGGDPDNNAQNPTNHLGKLIRIDVDNTDDGKNYAVPLDNPFVGTVDTLGEIWAFGMRNPWRFSFDRETGDMYIADVGQSSIEEINFQPAGSAGGENYGWRCKEGTAEYNFSDACPVYDLTDPITQYTHTGNRRSITGGYVYRGCAIPELDGVYFWADFESGEIFSARYDGETLTDSTDRTDELGLGSIFISSFGEDAYGELYIVDYGGGNIHKIVPVGDPGPCNLCCLNFRGNANADAEEKVNIGDVTYLIDYLFGIPSGPEPLCRSEGNANGDEGEDINISDVTYLVDYLFGIPLGPAPPACR